MNEINQLEVSAAQLGDIFNVSDRRIRQLAVAGSVVRSTKHGRYQLIASVKAHVAALEAEHNAPAKARREAKEVLEHELFLEKKAAEKGDVIPAAAFNHAVEALEKSGQRAINAMERELISHLWPKGIKDMSLVTSIANAADSSFCAWMNAAIDMIRRGANADEVRLHLFNSHASPPVGQVEFGTKQTRQRRQKKVEAAADE
ncbi:hypothetical protein [Ochrobactrum sp. MYb379]|uniref:hypothetical protein n=1 Tax=Ochrobactrum sp. MYb379 TaxID=2745275 RepID=UPI0030ACB702